MPQRNQEENDDSDDSDNEGHVNTKADKFENKYLEANEIGAPPKKKYGGKETNRMLKFLLTDG